MLNKSKIFSPFRLSITNWSLTSVIAPSLVWDILLNNNYEVAPYLMVSHVNDVKTSYLDSVYNQLTLKIKDSKYGYDLESLIQFRNKNKIN